MNSQELNRIIDIAASYGFKDLRLNPHSMNTDFDIIVSKLTIYLDNKQDKEYIKLSATKNSWIDAIDIKIDSFDKYFDLKSFW